MDPSALQKRRWQRLLTATSCWLPAVIGAAAGLWSMAAQAGLAGSGPGVGVLTVVAVAGLTVGFGSAAARWIFGYDKLTHQAAGDLELQIEQQHYAYLRGLQRRLRNDRDPRTGQCVRDLRDLYKRMDQTDLLHQRERPPALHDVFEQLQQLYLSCLNSLERSYELWKAASQATTPDTKQEMLKSRDTVLQEVQTSIAHLGRSLDQLQRADLTRTAELSEQNLAELRDELDAGLAVARRVEERMNQLEQDLQPRHGNREGS